MRFASGCFVVLGAMFTSACSGIQGGNEGERGPACVYDEVPIADPDAVPEGFDATPRALFSVAGTRFEGALPQADVRVRLEFEADYSGLVGRYRSVYSELEHCGPHLETPARARLTLLRENGTASDSAPSESSSLEVRWGVPLASARFATTSEPLASLAPPFSGELVTAPKLELWLSELDQARVPVRWLWSAFVRCQAGEQCSGGPAPGDGQVTNGAEIEWKNIELTRVP